MSDLKEYIVTLKNRNDLDAFYEDMETPGGALYIPDRAVELTLRRSTSRNTHYRLTAEEAALIKQDPRVAAIELTPAERGLVVRSNYTQTGNWNKSSQLNANHKNWGLLRCVEGQQRIGWGSDGFANQLDTITVTTSGRHVDVVIVDGHIDPAHPEYAVNSDGTGGSRVVQYNWFQHNLAVSGGPVGNYVYAPYVGGIDEEDNNHGAHVAGTACGNTQGWARSANIYNISPYSTNPNGDFPFLLFDYIREFHNSKTINPATGRRNPTIANNSWGYFEVVEAREITEVFYRNVLIPGPFTNAQLATYGLFVENYFGVDVVVLPVLVEGVYADIADAVDDGIIVVGAAGNNSSTLGVPYDADWENYITAFGETIYTSDLGTPGGAVAAGSKWGDLDPTTICVGAIDATLADRKVDFSNRGARIDIWAPGTNIQSSVHSGGVADSRNAAYQLIKYNGTSMASPQVCGVLACALEMYPYMNNAQARAYLEKYSKPQIANSSNNVSDIFSLVDSPNRYLAHRQERPIDGSVYPKTDYFIRPTSGQVYPRTRIKK